LTRGERMLVISLPTITVLVPTTPRAAGWSCLHDRGG
jgi:hypothetical protein